MKEGSKKALEIINKYNAEKEALKVKTYTVYMSERGAGRSYFYERMKKLNEGN